MLYDLEDKKPKNSGENWVAPNATVLAMLLWKKIQVFGLMRH